MTHMYSIDEMSLRLVSDSQSICSFTHRSVGGAKQGRTEVDRPHRIKDDDELYYCNCTDEKNQLQHHQISLHRDLYIYGTIFFCSQGKFICKFADKQYKSVKFRFN